MVTQVVYQLLRNDMLNVWNEWDSGGRHDCHRVAQAGGRFGLLISTRRLEECGKQTVVDYRRIGRQSTARSDKARGRRKVPRQCEARRGRKFAAKPYGEVGPF